MRDFKKDKSIEYQNNVANMFIEMLEKDGLEWKNAWKNIIHTPANASTGNDYSSINRFVLMMAMIKRNTKGHRFATFNQIRDEKYHKGQKWHLKKGSKAYVIQHTHWYVYERRQIEENEVNISVLKGVSQEEADKYINENGGNSKYYKKAYTNYTNVFNEDDIEGISPYIEKDEPKVEFNEKFVLDVARSIGVEIKNNVGDKAYYNNKNDEIVLPLKEQFNSQYDYDATAFHEINHATGHPSRLNREIANAFGSPKYAKEELVAEIGAAMVMSQYHFDIKGKHFNNHLAYVKSWSKIIKEDGDYLMEAIRQAVKANDYINKSYDRYITKLKKMENLKYKKIEDIPDINNYTKKQLESIDAAIKMGVDVSKMLDKNLTEEQMYWIAEGYSKGIDAGLYSDRNFSEEKMIVLRTAMIRGIDVSDICDPKISLDNMKEIIVRKENHQSYDDLLKTQKRQFKNGKKYDDEKYNIKLEDIKASVKIINYAEYLGYTVIKERNGIRHSLKEHDSLKIWDTNTYAQFSKTSHNSSKTMGGSIIDFIKEFDPNADNDLAKAISLAKDFMIKNNLKPDANIKSVVKQVDLFEKANDKSSYKELLRLSDYAIRNPELPKRNEYNSMRNIYGYLLKTRGIKKEVIDEWIQRNKLYQDDKYNAVFIEEDFDHKVKNIHVKGTNPEIQFRKDVANSNKILGISFKNENVKTLFITESVIDAMSIQSMGAEHKDRLENYDYLSLQGVNVDVLKNYFLTTDTTHLQNIYICTDNDAAGEACAKKLEEVIEGVLQEDKYELNDLEIGRLTPVHKDFNEDLLYNLDHQQQASLPSTQEENKEILQENQMIPTIS